MIIEGSTSFSEEVRLPGYPPEEAKRLLLLGALALPRAGPDLL
jgi:hypothetical protein